MNNDKNQQDQHKKPIPNTPVTSEKEGDAESKLDEIAPQADTAPDDFIAPDADTDQVDGQIANDAVLKGERASDEPDTGFENK